MTGTAARDDGSILAAVTRELPAVLTKKVSVPLVLSLLDEASKAIGEALKQRDEIIKKLESRVAELESRGNLKYVGVYRQGQMYYMGNFATHGGSIWHANEATMDTPAKARAGPWHASTGPPGGMGGTADERRSTRPRHALREARHRGER